MEKVERRLVWSRDAEEDLLSIWQYGADEWSPALADEHERAIGRACARLVTLPHFGRSREELLPELRSVVVDPHTIFYRVSEDAVAIVRVLHQGEDIETIFH